MSSKKKAACEEMRPQYRFNYRKARANRFTQKLKTGGRLTPPGPDVEEQAMAAEKIEARLSALEKEVQDLRSRLEKSLNNEGQPWWIVEAGRFAHDPEFEEMVKLGRSYRQSLRPEHRKKREKKK